MNTSNFKLKNRRNSPLARTKPRSVDADTFSKALDEILATQLDGFNALSCQIRRFGQDIDRSLGYVERAVDSIGANRPMIDRARIFQSAIEYGSVSRPIKKRLGRMG
ncbi:MAG: hypothetical protein ACHQU0_02405 [Candidatus Paceibacteria bacterium]